VALATRHGKERALAPLLEARLGVQVVLAEGVDTDRFGTFTREVPRPGGALEAARAKAEAALAACPAARFGLASEGSFGAHPHLPFVPGGHELVLLRERGGGLEVVGEHLTAETNFAHARAASLEEARAFARRAGFPSHALVVAACEGGEPAPHRALYKGVCRPLALERTVRVVLGACGEAHLETDMRAHLNPTRMRAIARAGRALVRRARTLCPACGRPGFGVLSLLPGRPCADCGRPTRLVREERWGCGGCGLQRGRVPPGGEAPAPPGACDGCNP
jgi:ribosomal protein L37E